jgi:hypothetical protein
MTKLAAGPGRGRACPKGHFHSRDRQHAATATDSVARLRRGCLHGRVTKAAGLNCHDRLIDRLNKSMDKGSEEYEEDEKA